MRGRPARVAEIEAALAVALAAAGCGGAPRTAPTEASSAHEAPRPRVLSFARELVRTRRTERNVSRVEGILTATLPEPDGGEHQLSITRARYAQGDYVVREIDPDTGATPVVLTQRVDGRGGAAPLGGEASMLLGEEIVSALSLVPVGSCGVALDPGGAEVATLSLGLPDELGIPRTWPGRCTRQPSPRPGRLRVTCAFPLDRALEPSPEARAQGITAELRGRVTLEGELETASGLCVEATHHLEMDLVERLGAYEEHEGATLEITTRLLPHTV